MNTSGNDNQSKISVQIDASTVEGRRLIVAMELLARAVDKSSLSVLQNLQRHATPAEKSRQQQQQAQPTTGAKPKDDKARPAGAKPLDKKRGPKEAQQWRKQKRAETLKKNVQNYAAYQARKQAGQKLGKYDRRTDYAKPMGSRFSASARRFNKAGAAGAKAAGGAMGGKGMGGGPWGVVLGVVLGLFEKLPNPLRLFTDMLNSSASGMGLLSKGMKLLAAVFAPILLPITVLLAAALLGMSDMLWDRMMPVLKGWFTLMMEVGIPVLKIFFDAIAFVSDWYVKIANAQVDVYNALIDLVNKIPGVNIPKLERIADPNEGRIPQWGGTANGGKYTEREKQIIKEEEDRAKQRSTEILEEIKRENKAAGKPEFGENNDAARIAHERAQREKEQRLIERGVDPRKEQRMPGEPGARPKMPDPKKLLGEIIQSLQLSMGPPATITDIGTARNNAQLAALNADPFEARILTMFAQTLDLLRQALGDADPPPPNPVRP